MISITQLNSKRRAKALKRKAKAKRALNFTLSNLKGRKARNLRKQAIKTILNNPVLLQKFVENQQKIQAEKEKITS